MSRVKLDSESIIIIRNYSALSTAIGGRDGMDGSRRLGMTRSNYRTLHQSRLLGVVLVVGDVGLCFSWKYIYM